MKKKHLKQITLILITLLFIQSIGFSHSGRTDSSGGHKDNKNASGLGYYHHGYGPHLHTNGCPYNVKPTTNSSSSSTSTSIATTKPHGKLPYFGVYINGDYINNTTSEYPIFVYNDITYFPMTWDYCNALGITTSYDSVDGLVINRDHESSLLNLPSGVSSGTKLFYFDKPTFNITLNSEKVDNGKLPYPILTHNYITYFPLTWDFVVNELGCSMEFNGTSLRIDSISQ